MLKSSVMFANFRSTSCAPDHGSSRIVMQPLRLEDASMASEEARSLGQQPFIATAIKPDVILNGPVLQSRHRYIPQLVRGFI